MDIREGLQSTSSIKAIDKRSVHQICSGQVILSLATAVKELVENSIDAGATNVEIKLREFGIDLIEVHDNGSGIEEKDFEAIATKHCTSKLASFSDLTIIETFGFRGEALSSLCALSKLTVITRHHSKGFGFKLKFDYDGKLESKTPCAREIGTTVIVSQLFHSLPVRHKEFQRNIKKEFPKLSSVLQAYGIISTGVRLSCINVADKNRKTTIISTHGSESVLDNIASIFGPKQVQSLLTVVQREPTDEVLECYKISAKAANESKDVFKLEGYISRVDHGCGRASPDRQFYFINKRPCDIAKVSRLINEMYHMFNRHQNPFVFLNISLNSDMVDVNITPDKRQIFVQNEKVLLAGLRASLLSMFTETAGQYEVNSKIQDASNSIFCSLSSLNQTNSPSQNRSGSGESLKCANEDDEPSCRKPQGKQTKENVSDAVNGGISISSVLKNLRNKFSRSPTKSPNNTSSQISIEKFIHTVEKEKSSVINLERDPAIGKGGFCGENDLNGFCSETKYSTLPVPRLDRVSPVNSPKPQNQEFNGQEGSLSPDDKSDKTHINSTEMEIDSKNLLESRSNQNLVTLEADENCLLIEGQDIHMTGNKQGQCAEGKIRSPLCLPIGDENILAKEILDSSEVHLYNHSFETPCKQDEPVDIPTRINDINSCLGTENPCKRPRLSRPEVRIPFDFDKLRDDLNLLSSRNVIDHEPQLGFHAKISPGQNDAAEEELRKNITKDMFKEMEIMGQFNLGFIIGKINNDLFIIDQHATDEKYNFETLQKEHCLKGQRLIQPRALELTPTNESILIDNIEIFRKNGFEFLADETQPSGSKVKLVSLPTSRNWTFGIQDIEELLFMLSDSPGIMCRPSRVRSMFASRACRMSTMVGTALSHSQMKTLVNHMAQIEHPWNCPHGRPTMRHLVNLNRINKITDSHSQSEE